MGTPISQLFDLSGRIALVTGGSRGLGLQIAEALGDAVSADPARVLDVDTVSALLATTGLAPVDQVVVHDVEAACDLVPLLGRRLGADSITR